MAEGDGDLPPERTQEELEARQENELEELEEKKQALIESAKASAGKGKKAKEKIEAAEREAEQLEYDMRERHREELERLLEHLEGGGGGYGAVAAVPAPVPAPKAAAEEIDEAERAQRKKEKGLKKRQGRAAKEAEREAAREREKLEAGPAARDLENEALDRRLAACRPPLQVHEVAADGNCLYHAVADQLRRVRPDLHECALPAERAYEEVRRLCASSLRQREEDYSPFAELKDDEDFAGYCTRVATSADWGGELELRALADALRVRILVHRAEESEVLTLGEEKSGSPLQVSYHRHYYALGEHYNSVIPRTAK